MKTWETPMPSSLRGKINTINEQPDFQSELDKIKQIVAEKELEIPDWQVTYVAIHSFLSRGEINLQNFEELKQSKVEVTRGNKRNGSLDRKQAFGFVGGDKMYG